MGGSAVARALAGTGLRVAIVERGGPLKQEPQNWDPDAVIRDRRYDPDDRWYDGEDNPFVPRVYYNYGGSSKFFGGSAFRLRERDFLSHTFPGGDTVEWPITYQDLAPFYDEAEMAMHVHGLAGSDPTEPPRGQYPYAPLEHEPAIADLAERLSRRGVTPFPLPIAVHQGDGGHCRKGSPCDGFPCKIRAKYDGENAFLRPALRDDPSITIFPYTTAHRLGFETTGRRVTRVETTGSGDAPEAIEADVVVLAAGTVNSAALLLRSTPPGASRGPANGSDQVGRNFMAHNNTVLTALSPFRLNPTWFQKTLAFNDFYHDGGNVQMRGKILPQNLRRSGSPVTRLFPRAISRRSFDFWVMSEDLPDPENRVLLRNDESIQLIRHLNNGATHKELVKRVGRLLREVSLPIIFDRPPSAAAIQHQVGTLRAGTNPDNSVVDGMG
ncbi:MAG: GMC family oxidoreductase, partial [Spirochaeta sp.]|nr:GMC family oxidoreductase [Spirochaeta sp.]